MRTKFLSIVFAALAFTLVMDAYVVQPLISHDSNLAYAAWPKNNHPERTGTPHRPVRLQPVRPGQPAPISVPEPSTLILLGMGVTGIGFYSFSMNRKAKK